MGATEGKTNVSWLAGDQIALTVAQVSRMEFMGSGGL